MCLVSLSEDDATVNEAKERARDVSKLVEGSVSAESGWYTSLHSWTLVRRSGFSIIFHIPTSGFSFLGTETEVPEVAVEGSAFSFM